MLYFVIEEGSVLQRITVFGSVFNSEQLLID